MLVFLNKENRASILHYVAIYCMISSGGMALPGYMGNDWFIILLLLIGGYYVVAKHTLVKLQRHYLVFIGLLLAAMLTVVAASTLSIGTTLNVLSVPIITYAVYKMDPKHCIRRFITILYYIAIVSIVLFAVTRMLGFAAFSFIHPFLFQSFTGAERETYSYGGFLYRFVLLHNDRNCGPFNEPGQYQCVLAVALYFSLFRSYLFKKENVQRYTIVFFLALITTLSTSGYIAIGILVTCYFCWPAQNRDKRTKRIFLLVCALTLVVLFSTEMGGDFIQTTIYNKIYEGNAGGRLNLEQNTSGVRVASISGVLQSIAQDPLILVGIGYDQLASMKLEGCAGLLYILLAIGILPYSILFGFCFYQVYRYNRGISDIAVRILLVVNMGLGQPHIMNTTLFMMMLYPYFRANSLQRKRIGTKKADV